MHVQNRLALSRRAPRSYLHLVVSQKPGLWVHKLTEKACSVGVPGPGPASRQRAVVLAALGEGGGWALWN